MLCIPFFWVLLTYSLSISISTTPVILLSLYKCLLRCPKIFSSTPVEFCYFCNICFFPTFMTAFNLGYPPRVLLFSQHGYYTLNILKRFVQSWASSVSSFSSEDFSCTIFFSTSIFVSHKKSVINKKVY